MITLPQGWIAGKQHGQFFMAKRGLESAIFHRHDSRTGNAYVCEWVGRDVRCPNCDTLFRLPAEPVSAEAYRTARIMESIARHRG
jgi:hypothetical protein